MSENTVEFDGQSFRIVSHGAAGDCLFNCLSSQLQIKSSQLLREQIVTYICNNWGDYEIYISDIFNVADRDSYAAMMSRGGEYGSLVELRAACSIYNIGVVVVRQRRDGTYFSLDVNITDTHRHIYMLFTGNDNGDHFLDGHFQILEPDDLEGDLNSFEKEYEAALEEAISSDDELIAAKTNRACDSGTQPNKNNKIEKRGRKKKPKNRKSIYCGKYVLKKVLAPPLATYLRVKNLSKSEVISRIFKQVETKKLYDPKDDEMINCDAELEKLFECKNFKATQLPDLIKPFLS